MNGPSDDAARTEEFRRKLDNRLAPVHLYKLTPKTNCGECGFATCLAFSTQAIVGQVDLSACPHLRGDEVEAFRERLAEQLGAGIGVKREGFEKALQFLRGEILKWDFACIVEGLGAELLEADGRPALKFPYLGRDVVVTAEDIHVCDAGEPLNPYQKIFLYNYVIGGATEPSGVWVGMESLPNSVSKIKSLRDHCEGPLARESAGKMARLPGAVAGMGRGLALEEEKVDFAAEFQVLPKLAIRILWWDEEVREGFRAETKFLFDSKVLEVLDLESLVFTCEQLTDSLLERLKG